MPVKSKSKASQIKRRLIAILGGSPCYKLIDYQASIWKVSLSADATDVVTVDLKEITKQSQEITLATNHAKLLDDYQFFYAKILRGGLMIKSISKSSGGIELWRRHILFA
jgi:hypothetical protein